MQKPQTPPPAPLRHLDRKNLGVRLGTAFVFAAFFLTLLYLGDRPAPRPSSPAPGRGPVHGSA